MIYLFDIDGVLIRVNKYYSYILENKGFIGAVSILNHFYNGPENHACLMGKENPLLAIKPFLDSIGWTKTTEDYFQEQFEYESQYLDTDFLSIITKLRKSGRKCFLATDQDSYRSKYLLEELEFNTLFDGWFISSRLGYRKSDPEYWRIVSERLEAELGRKYNSETLFIDDIFENIQAAQGWDFCCYHVSSNESIESLKRELIDSI